MRSSERSIAETTCWEHHPATELDLDAFCALPHAMMSLSGHGPSFVDHALAGMGRTRRVVARIPYLLALPYVLHGTDLISMVVTDAAEHFVRHWHLRSFPSPLELPAAPLVLLWHGRYQADPAHQWFRALVADAMRLGAPGTHGVPHSPS